MKRFFLRGLSVFLTIALILVSLPMSAIAASVLGGNSATSNLGDSAEVLGKTPYELIELRTLNTKCFRLEDGSYYTVQYPVNVHFMDENGIWQEINNELTVDGSEITTADQKIKFAKKMTGNGNLFTLHNANRKISFSLNNANKKTEAKIIALSELSSDMSELQKMTVQNNIFALVQYEDILPQTNIEYRLEGDSVKEYIIVKEQRDAYTYSFTMSLNNLIAQMKDGEIEIFDPNKGDVLYTIPRPMMWDANGAESDLVSMTLIDHENGKYTISIVADGAWINADERALPVTIDPPIYAGNNSDTICLSADMFQDTISHSELNVSYWRRSYLKIPTASLPKIPSSAYITNASITLHTNSGTSFDEYIGVYEVLSDWDSSITVDDIYDEIKGTISDSFTDFQHISATEDPMNSDANTCAYTWNITPLIKKWYNGENYGLALEAISDEYFFGSVGFYSNTYSTSSVRPCITISYRDMKGLEDYWSYISQSAGFAGTGSINLATGGLVWQIPTLTSTDALMPYTPTLVYQSTIDNNTDQTPTEESAYASTYAPYGFKLNIQETLIKKAYVDQAGVTKCLFIWSDSDRTDHYFLPTQAEGIYEDEDGLLLKLTEYGNDYTVPDDEHNCTIVDSNKTVRHFYKLPNELAGSSSVWYLSKIVDKVGNTLSFSFDDRMRPTTVNLIPNGTETPIEQLKLYYSNDVLRAVWNPNSGDVVVLRYSDTYNGAYSTTAKTYLRKIERVHGITTQEILTAYCEESSIVSADAIAYYTYNADGQMLSAKNGMTSYTLTYTYSENQITSVSETAGSANSVGQTVGVEYLPSSAIVRTSGTDDAYNTSDDLRTVYNFDNEGRCINCYTTDLNGTTLYGASSGTYEAENEKAKNSIKTAVSTSFQASNLLLNGDFEALPNAGSTVQYWVTSGNVSQLFDSAKYGRGEVKLRLSSAIRESMISQTIKINDGDYTFSFRVFAPDVLTEKMYVKLSGNKISKTFEVPLDKSDATGSYLYNEFKISKSDFTAPGNAEVTVSVSVSGNPTGNKDFFIDNLMLNPTNTAAESDTVEMGHFENISELYDEEDIWIRPSDMETTVGHATEAGWMNQVLTINPAFGENAVVEQVIYEIPESYKESYEYGDYRNEAPFIYKITGWGKGSACYSDESKFALTAVVYYYVYKDGEYQTQEKTYTFDFDKSITDWQFISGGFVASHNNPGLVEKIVLRIEYQNNNGIGYFDSITAVRESQTIANYDYGNNGYLTHLTNANVETWYEYDSKGNLTREIQSTGNVSIYEYHDDKNYLMREIHLFYYKDFSYNEATKEIKGELLVKDTTEYTYNEQGLIIEYPTYFGETDSLLSSGEKEYITDTSSHFIGKTTAIVDAMMGTTRYFYYEDTGRLKDVIYPDGNGVRYIYDALGNVIDMKSASLTIRTENDLPVYEITVSENSISTEYNYNSSGSLEELSTESTTYHFVYDDFGNKTGIFVDDSQIVGYTYNLCNGKIKSLTYANGKVVQYIYDHLDRISEICYNFNTDASSTACRYTYDAMGNLSLYEDFLLGQKTVYEYDETGNLYMKLVYSIQDNELLYKKTIHHDTQNRKTLQTNGYQYSYSDSLSQSYSYDTTTGYLSGVTYRNVVYGGISLQYDDRGRISNRSTNIRAAQATTSATLFSQTETYEYDYSIVTKYISQVGTDSSTVNTYDISYDDNYNITQIKDENNVIQNQYSYDDFGRLIREDNRTLDKTYVYTYNTAGNLTCKQTYAFTTDILGNLLETVYYSYLNPEWGDLLTSYGDWNVEYDEIGNPTFLYIQVDETWQNGYSLIWDGRQLIGIQQSERINGEMGAVGEGTEIEYNADGIRVYMYTPYATHYYTVDEGTVLEEKLVDSNGAHYLVYLYDENQAPMGIKYSGINTTTISYYFFEKNIKGDIIGIYNTSGTKIASYIYDAWGNFTVEAGDNISSEDEWMVNNNPFRYRGYYYDVETGWYYLQGRYYDPEIGRFINSNLNVSSNGGLFDNNLYLYCNNNPVGGLGVNNVYAPHFGTAWFHTDSGDPISNCYSYALGFLGFPLYIGKESNFAIVNNGNVYEVALAFEADMIALGITVRRIKSAYSPISQNEYRIALRVEKTGVQDFHFMVQTNTGQWAEQQGQQGIVRVHQLGANPNMVKWSEDNPSCNYNSNIIYYAVTK